MLFFGATIESIILKNSYKSVGILSFTSKPGILIINFQREFSELPLVCHPHWQLQVQGILKHKHHLPARL
jgi:hypothetical protein